VLSLVAIGLVAKKQLVLWLRARARIAAQTARIAETARLKREHATVLSKLQPPPPPPAPKPPPTVGLTQLIRTLEHSTLFTPIPQAELEAPSPRSRMAKGSIPMPMTNSTPMRAMPSPTPRHAPALPPPIPRRPSASVPPPIPARRPPPPRRGR
jgi:hypothetical protein